LHPRETPLPRGLRGSAAQSRRSQTCPRPQALPPREADLPRGLRGSAAQSRRSQTCPRPHALPPRSTLDSCPSRLRRSVTSLPDMPSAPSSPHVKHPCHVDLAAPPLSHVAPRHAPGPKCMQACLVASDMSSLLHVDSIFRSAWCRYDPAPPSA